MYAGPALWTQPRINSKRDCTGDRTWRQASLCHEDVEPRWAIAKSLGDGTFRGPEHL